MKKGKKLYHDLCFVKRMSDEGELLEVTQSFVLQIPQANWITWKERHLPEINSEALNNYLGVPSF